MPLLFALLVMLILIDHYLKNKRFAMLYYKNDHTFHVAVAIRYHHPRLEALFDLASRSKHQFTFVIINGAISPKEYPDHTFIELSIDEDPTVPAFTLEALSRAYYVAYPEMDGDFLLFMDAEVAIHSSKVLDFMANNLVEHQVYTTKPLVERLDFKDGPKLFFDLFRDFNQVSDGVNMQFFAIKRSTYNLVGGPEHVFKRSAEFDAKLFNKNISMIYIQHDGRLKRVSGYFEAMHPYRHFIDDFSYGDNTQGRGKMALFLLGLHAFYIYTAITHPLFLIPLHGLIVATAMLTLRHSLRYPLFVYVLLPVWVIIFDGLYVAAHVSRFKCQRTLKCENPPVVNEEEHHD